MNKLKFSIVMPTYNGVNLVGNVLDSVFSQGFQDYEIIVSNDSPFDNAQMKEKLDSYNDPRIRFFGNKENMGYPLNLRQAVSKANNEILFLLAQDDILLENALQKTHDAFFLDDNIGAITRPYYQFYSDYKKPARIVAPYSKDKDCVLDIRSSERVVQKVFETLGQLSGLAYRKEFITHPFHKDVFPAHIYPWASITLKHKIVFLKDYTVAIQIPTSQTIFKSSIYTLSPTETWVQLFNTVYVGKDFKNVREWGIKFMCTTNFVGLAQIKNYGSYSWMLREVWILIKYYPKNLVNPKFWIFSLGAVLIPKKLLVKLIFWYKKKFVPSGQGFI